jgi:hypothetical protein
MISVLSTALMCLIALLLVARTLLVNGDQNFYDNSDASVQSMDYPDLTQSVPSAILDIATSKTLLAGTSNQFIIYLVGEFSVSGPHTIGPFVEGSHVKVNINLVRKIGELVGVEFQAGGTDGWLLQTLNVQIGGIVYLLKGPRQWLDRIDLANEHAYRTYIDSWEPLQSEDPTSIPVGSKLKLQVVDKYFAYNSDKILPFTT